MKKSKHSSDNGIGKWYFENWKSAARFCRTFGIIKAMINNANRNPNGLFFNVVHVVNGGDIYDNGNCAEHTNHSDAYAEGNCDQCVLTRGMRNFQLFWESLERDERGFVLDVSCCNLERFIKLIRKMICTATFPNCNGGYNYKSFVCNVDELLVKTYRRIIAGGPDSKSLRKEFAKLKSKVQDFTDLTGLYQKTYQHVKDDIQVDWFAGAGGCGDEGFIMGTRIRIVVATFRTMSIDYERILLPRITRALDIIGRPRELGPPDNVLIIGSRRSRAKRRWSEGNVLIYNDRNEICRGLLYEFLFDINNFKNCVRDPYAIMTYE